MGAASVYPLHFFKSGGTKRKAGYCFVLMPFDPGMREVFHTIKEEVESPPWNFICRRAEDFYSGGHILVDILTGIAEAEVVIADLTGRNPNVFYELGIAHTIREPDAIILLTQSMDSVPFDLRGFRVIEYAQTIEGARTLRQQLTAALRQVSQPVYRFSIRQGATYDFPHKLPGDERCLYGFSVFADYLGIQFVKCSVRVRKYIAGQSTPTEFGPDPHGIGVGDIRQLPHFPWALRLDESDEQEARFAVVHWQPSK